MSGVMRIVDAYWDRFLAVEPLFATAVGDARFDSATATVRGCCWVWWHSSNLLRPPHSGLPICGGWPRSPPTLRDWLLPVSSRLRTACPGDLPRRYEALFAVCHPELGRSALHRSYERHNQ